MTFRCGNCTKDSIDCACLGGPVHFCNVCGLSPSYKGFDDCLQCGVAYLLTDPTQLALLRKLHAGTEWLHKLNVEVTRQLGTTMDAGRQTA